MLTDNSFQNLSDPVVGISESFIGRLFARIKQVARRVISDPEAMINIQQVIRDVRSEHEEYLSETTEWVDGNLPVAYMRGLKETDGTIRKLDIDASPTAPIVKGTQLAGSGGGGGAIAPTAADILQNYPRHHTMYSVFQEAAYEGFAQTQFPVVRDVQGKVREIIIQASEEAYQESNMFTRRQMTQDLMDRFADQNITGITYSDGRRVNLDAYSEMIARSQTGNAARQASMNRQQQYGYDLVRISTHFPCSDLCVDQQGNVYSISGTSDQYPPLDQAIGNGLYHSNCYSEDTEVFTSEGWKKFYELSGELIYSLNPETHETEFVHYDKVIEKENVGWLYSFGGSNINLDVTPNHRMYCSYDRKEYDFIEAHETAQFLDRPTFHLCGFDAKSVTRAEPPTRLFYDRTAYCVELVKNHVILVRREGTNNETWCGNCKHFQNPYFPGISPKQEIRQEELSKKENRKRYEATQRQRTIERRIRKYKRRESAALTDEAREKARNKVRDWQARQRELVDSNDFLRRKYQRESIN